jgi:hypothetical protein
VTIFCRSRGSIPAPPPALPVSPQSPLLQSHLVSTRTSASRLSISRRRLTNTTRVTVFLPVARETDLQVKFTDLTSAVSTSVWCLSERVWFWTLPVYVMCKVRALPVCVYRAYRGEELQLHTFLYPALDGGERSISHPRPL